MDYPSRFSRNSTGIIMNKVMKVPR
ncbi:hypothetical protein F383_08648 [Gossypium arboreum]|uniref:Uncharacterized protein n=1 Tax=Gossypium arboreum TaxID=29729 RepID=A0A0B0NGX3_GOSAR|nr:hypothetical protein F383_08648 [Gossypium arboreum]